MKNEGKSYYEAPATIVVEVKIEGMVCQSNVNGMINPNDEKERYFKGRTACNGCLPRNGCLQ